MAASKAQPQKIAPANQPNQYELQGGRTKVTYSTSSIAGTPQFHYKDATRNLSFSGSQIEVVRTSLAEEVTVTLTLLADGPGIKFTLIVPDVMLGGKTESKLSTFGVIVTTKGGLVGPLPAKGQRQTYKIVALDGVAKLVEF